MQNLSEEDKQAIITALEFWTNEFYKKGSRAYKEKVELAERLKDMFRPINDKERTKGRSEGYHGLSAEEQWDEDKRLGILDWDGN